MNKLRRYDWDNMDEDKLSDVLFCAIDQDHEHTLLDYLQKEGDPNLVIDDESLMIRAIINCKLWAIKLLLKYNVDIDKKDPHGMTPLMRSVVEARDLLVETLIQAGADIDAVNDKGKTAMDVAVALNYQSCMKALVENGVDPNFKVREGLTIWNSLESESAFEAFVKAGGDLRGRDDRGNNALHIAVKWAHKSLIKMLVNEHKMDPNTKNAQDETPLMAAASCGYLSICQDLLNAGADVTVVSKFGETAYGMAEDRLARGEKGDMEVFQLLVKAKKDALEKVLTPGKRKVDPSMGRLKF